MKNLFLRIELAVCILCLAMLTGCASINIAQTPLAKATQADLAAAAAYAQANGYPAIAAVYTSQAAQLTAINGQIQACLDAIAASKPKLPTDNGNVGPILAFEMARETVGTFTGVSATVKLNCEPIPLIALPALPKIP